MAFCGGNIIESSFHMKIVIQNDSLVRICSSIDFKELGVVVTSLLLTSRVGAGLTAEVGSMQVTEQIDALRMLGIDPIKFLVVPGLLPAYWGGIILSIVANIACLYCAMLVSQMKLGYSVGGFITSMRAFVSIQDLILPRLKARFLEQ